MQSRLLPDIESLAPLSAASHVFVFAARFFGIKQKAYCAAVRFKNARIIADQTKKFENCDTMICTASITVVMSTLWTHFVDHGFAPIQLLHCIFLLVILPYCMSVRTNLYDRFASIKIELSQIQDYLLNRFEQIGVSKEFFASVIEEVLWAVKIKTTTLKIRLVFGYNRQKRTELAVIKIYILPNAPSL